MKNFLTESLEVKVDTTFFTFTKTSLESYPEYKFGVINY